jgi:hypothetical protein
MNDLRELIGKTVTATIAEDENGCDVEIKCKITSLYIDDYYFEEKMEPIYITVNVDPIEDMGENFDYDLCNDISLTNIRK